MTNRPPPVPKPQEQDEPANGPTARHDDRQKEQQQDGQTGAQYIIYNMYARKTAPNYNIL